MPEKKTSLRIMILDAGIVIYDLVKEEIVAGPFHTDAEAEAAYAELTK